MKRTNISRLFLLVLISSPQVKADDWTRFRGPKLDGISTETIAKKSGDLAVVWKSRVGLGHSSFVVAEGKVYTSGHNGKDTDTLYCFDALTGKVVWEHAYAHPLDDLYYQGGTAGTPTIDGAVLYHLARRGQLFCFDAATGNIRWSKHLTTDFGLDMPTWGFAGSPLVDGEQLLLNAGDAGLALNKSDGSLIWKSENGEAGYSTPLPFVRAERKLALFSNKRGYVCVDRTSGEALWRIKWLTRYGVNAAMPVLSGDYLFISSGYGKGSSLLRFSDDNPAMEPVEVWKSRDFICKMNAPILKDGFLYGIHGEEGQDRTGLKCVNLLTGETSWFEEDIGHGAIAATNGQLIVLSEKGELLVAPLTPEAFKPTLTMNILGPKCWTIPVLSNGFLYCRNDAGAVVALEFNQ